MYTMSTKATKNAMMKGTALAAIAIGFSLDRFDTTNKLSPNGGVAKPIAKQQTRTTPKWTGSTPKASIAGNRIGAKIMIAGPVSITIPRIRNRIMQKVRAIQASPNVEVMKLVIAADAPVRESTRPNAVAKASTNAKPPYVRTAVTMMFQMSLILMVL